jgi:hypothetical protein
VDVDGEVKRRIVFGPVPGFDVSTDLADVVHPNTSGHRKIFNYVKTFFGL